MPETAAMDLVFDDRGSHLHALAVGDWNPRTMQETIVRLRDEANKLGHQRILLDGRQVHPPASDFYRYVAGQDAARFLPPPFRTAVIGLPTVVTGFGETVANIGGADLRVFVADEPALEWRLREREQPNG